MELISVIVPVYNVEKYLSRCIESIQNQTYKNLEIILVDDGSPDACPGICDDYAALDTRIKVIHKENGGLGFARNSGLELASGKYLTFIDSDDTIEYTHIENLYSAIKETNADGVIGSHTSVTPDGVKTFHPLLIKEGIYENESILNNIVLPLIGPDVDFPSDVQVNSSCWTNLYKTDIIRENNLKFINEKYAVAEDFYFNVDFFYHCKKITALNESGYYYFENSESISHKYNPLRFQRTLNYYKTINEQTEKLGLSDKTEHRKERSFLMKIRVAMRLIVLSDMKHKEKVNELRTILSHETVKTVLQNYPINKFIPSMRIFVKMMRAENIFGVILLIKLREFAKKQKILKAILRRMGIGK